jgi:hypothetical protein
MKTELLFPTVLNSGHIDLDIKTINDYKKWVEVEKLITPGIIGSTTHNGYQRALGPTDVEPKWFKDIMAGLTDILTEIALPIKSSWIVSYNTGGFQDPHIHPSSSYTLIVNIQGDGDLLLFDPRPMAVALSEPFAKNIILNPGDWVAFPGTLSHASRPCNNSRDILVIDFALNKYLVL